MAGSVNKCILIGNLGKDPESRNMPNGDVVVSFSIATTESWKDKNTGEKQERTQWHNIVIWNQGIAGIAERYLEKGAKVYIEGQLETRKWQDKDGHDRYTTEVVVRFNGAMTMLSSPNGSNRAAPREDNQYSQVTGPRGHDATGRSTNMQVDELEDEIPF